VLSAARARKVSDAPISLNRRKFVQYFKGIICDDISEFESCRPSQSVRATRPGSFASYAGRPPIDEIELHVLDLLTLT
jgi:hypothetical protein